MSDGPRLVAITGSTGLISTALRRSLEADGHQVRPVVRRPVRSGESAVTWDPDAGTIDTGALEGVDAVVHLAGAGIGDERWTDERKRVILESRTRGTGLLARTLAALDAKPSVLISGSAIGYYGDRGDETLTETSGPGNDFLASICVPWEAEARPVTEAGIRLATIRTGIVLTTEGGALPKMLPLFKLGLGGPYGSGHQWWSWITLTDEVAAIRHLLDHDVHGPVNLTAPRPVVERELAKTLGRVMHRPCLLPVPKFGPKLVVGAELAEALLFTSAKVMPTVLEGSGFTFAHPDIETALRAVLGREAAAP
ncbi:MAG: TIGR01777 family oxidoreductase [Acidimicrobiales bacterium]